MLIYYLYLISKPVHKIYNFITRNTDENKLTVEYYLSSQFGFELFIVGLLFLLIGLIFSLIITISETFETISLIFIFIGVIMSFRGLIKIIVAKLFKK